ncbi:hypothetical protein CYMTET_43230 [Cymbomonas tetramitiformis]|uniref:Uncharacterized protein n=1 Tax=Cymbomonas tetramitiformis TaxID=36881 RepID=A0AAE0C2M6_9CHLO|nr:hypothetical protein CYMTET_43230 [Cymbomonas tetramitiformis]
MHGPRRPDEDARRDETHRAHVQIPISSFLYDGQYLQYCASASREDTTSLRRHQKATINAQRAIARERTRSQLRENVDASDEDAEIGRGGLCAASNHLLENRKRLQNFRGQKTRFGSTGRGRRRRRRHGRASQSMYAADVLDDDDLWRADDRDDAVYDDGDDDEAGVSDEVASDDDVIGDDDEEAEAEEDDGCRYSAWNRTARRERECDDSLLPGTLTLPIAQMVPVAPTGAIENLPILSEVDDLTWKFLQRHSRVCDVYFKLSKSKEHTSPFCILYSAYQENQLRENGCDFEEVQTIRAFLQSATMGTRGMLHTVGDLAATDFMRRSDSTGLTYRFAFVFPPRWTKRLVSYPLSWPNSTDGNEETQAMDQGA